MINKKFITRTYILFFALLSFIFPTGCIEDGFVTDVSARPEFSTDTLDMGLIFTGEQSATHRFLVHNPHNKGLNISNIAVTGENASMFRINVDGMAGTSFKDIEIRANDSIFVFVSADLPDGEDPAPRNYTANLDFLVNGQVSTVLLSAEGQNIKRKKGVVLTGNTRYKEGMPYQITDSLVVEYGATLTLDAGTKLLFHDGASLIVRGTLISKGTAEKPVILTGDRMGNVITDVSFDLMSRQWAGVEFWGCSSRNRLEFTEISNTSYGVIVYGDGIDVADKKLTMTNCRLHNSGENVLTAIGASVEARGCEFAEAAFSLVYLLGGDHRFDLCTASNHYLFSAVTGAAWMLPDVTGNEQTAEMKPTKALITNSITYGLGYDVVPGDLTGQDIYFKRCLFKAEGTDDDNFIESIWNQDPLFYTMRSDYIFDYRLKPESPAISAAYTDLSDKPLKTDFYGVPRAKELGAYSYVAPEE